MCDLVWRFPKDEVPLVYENVKYGKITDMEIAHVPLDGNGGPRDRKTSNHVHTSNRGCLRDDVFTYNAFFAKIVV